MKPSAHISIEYKQQWKSRYLRFAHILKSRCPLACTDSHPDSDDRMTPILIPYFNNIFRHRSKNFWDGIASVSLGVNTNQHKDETQEVSDSPTDHHANS